MLPEATGHDGSAAAHRRRLSSVYAAAAVAWGRENGASPAGLAAWMVQRHEQAGNYDALLRRWGYGHPLALADPYLAPVILYGGRPQVTTEPGVLRYRHDPTYAGFDDCLAAFRVSQADMEQGRERYAGLAAARVGVEHHSTFAGGTVTGSIRSALAPPPPPSPWAPPAGAGLERRARLAVVRNLCILLGSARDLGGRTPEQTGRFVAPRLGHLRPGMGSLPRRGAPGLARELAGFLLDLSGGVRAMGQGQSATVEAGALDPDAARILHTYGVYPDDVGRFLNALGAALAAPLGLAVATEVGFAAFRVVVRPR